MADGVAELRSFNRFYTQRIGVLTDRYLGRDRPLAEARLLFEIGSDGAPLSDLRERMGLDSGYLSRLLRSLERDGLIETLADHGADARLKTARPTPAGRIELGEMSRRADEQTARLVEHLAAAELRELLDGLGTVERLLRRPALDAGGGAAIRRAVAADASAVAGVLAEVFAEQRAEFTPEAFAASTPTSHEVGERIAAGPVWVAEHGQRVVGTVSVTPRPPSLWVRGLAVVSGARGAGLAGRLLGEAERYAHEHGFARLQLDTTPFQTAAARLYARFGFLPVRRHQVHGSPMIRMTKRLS